MIVTGNKQQIISLSNFELDVAIAEKVMQQIVFRPTKNTPGIINGAKHHMVVILILAKGTNGDQFLKTSHPIALTTT